jgi:hypothetical protein
LLEGREKIYDEPRNTHTHTKQSSTNAKKNKSRQAFTTFSTTEHTLEKEGVTQLHAKQSHPQQPTNATAIQDQEYDEDKQTARKRKKKER